jgi:hypothetical protein
MATRGVDRYNNDRQSDGHAPVQRTGKASFVRSMVPY